MCGWIIGNSTSHPPFSFYAALMVFLVYLFVSLNIEVWCCHVARFHQVLCRMRDIVGPHITMYTHSTIPSLCRFLQNENSTTHHPRSRSKFLKIRVQHLKIKTVPWFFGLRIHHKIFSEQSTFEERSMELLTKIVYIDVWLDLLRVGISNFNHIIVHDR